MDIEIGEVGSAGLLPESLLVDLPEIDAQHEEIFNRIESLKSACFESTLTPIDEFESLLAYFAFHFATEERLADAVGLDFVEHARIHAETLALLRKALDELIRSGRDAHSFLRYCEYWFERHISEDDRLSFGVLSSADLDPVSGLTQARGPFCSAQA